MMLDIVNNTLLNALSQPNRCSVMSIYQELDTVIAIHGLNDWQSFATKTNLLKFGIKSFPPHRIIGLNVYIFYKTKLDYILPTFDKSMKAVENCHFLPLAFCRRVERRKVASVVLRPFRNPNWWGPRKSCFSDISVIFLHIRTVISLNRFEGIVIGLYWEGASESPP